MSSTPHTAKLRDIVTEKNLVFVLKTNLLPEESAKDIENQHIKFSDDDSEPLPTFVVEEGSNTSSFSSEEDGRTSSLPDSESESDSEDDGDAMKSRNPEDLGKGSASTGDTLVTSSEAVEKRDAYNDAEGTPEQSASSDVVATTDDCGSKRKTMSPRTSPSRSPETLKRTGVDSFIETEDGTNHESQWSEEDGVEEERGVKKAKRT